MKANGAAHRAGGPSAVPEVPTAIGAIMKIHDGKEYGRVGNTGGAKNRYAGRQNGKAAGPKNGENR